MIPAAEDFLQDSFTISHFYDDKTDRMVCFADDVKKAMIEFARLHVRAASEAQAKRILEIYDEFISAECREDLELCRDIDFCAFVDDLADDVTIEYPLSNIK